MEIRLQGIGLVSTTKQAKDIRIDDVLIWNYGFKEKVTKIIRETKSTILIGIQSENGYESNRRIYKKTWVAYEKTEKPLKSKQGKKVFELHSKKKKTLYIAYGSNLNVFQMAMRCPTAKAICASEVKGYELLFRGSYSSAVATIEPKQGGSVPVLVWELEAADEKSLDRYEGWPRFYRKENMKVEINGKLTEVMVYIMNDGYRIGSPGESYYKSIFDGYISAGFDTDILNKAVKKSEMKAVLN